LGSDNFTGIGAIAFSPDGTIIAAGSTWYYLILWDVKTGKKLRVVDETGAISVMAFSPDGTMIATGHAGSGITQWVDVWGIN
jgi:WD40 repeat protein